ncbi:hypothetical protein BTN50_0177 [Candidatus Enterovibrio altilux]|uniref:Uncharacterized protein n=1 Tax=Candidatus Enterovibrio altilux TaxID=1927128 RepID=A0A291B6U2_9GAMM|nr:hypothetical protein BTN50_0177 [Candidatus Enterovibrio luxaltus]
MLFATSFALRAEPLSANLMSKPGSVGLCPKAAIIKFKFWVCGVDILQMKD